MLGSFLNKKKAAWGTIHLLFKASPGAPMADFVLCGFCNFSYVFISWALLYFFLYIFFVFLIVYIFCIMITMKTNRNTNIGKLCSGSTIETWFSVATSLVSSENNFYFYLNCFSFHADSNKNLTGDCERSFATATSTVGEQQVGAQSSQKYNLML